MRELLLLQNKVNNIMLDRKMPIKIKEKVAKSFNECLTEIIEITSVKTYNEMLIKEAKRKNGR